MEDEQLTKSRSTNKYMYSAEFEAHSPNKNVLFRASYVTCSSYCWSYLVYGAIYKAGSIKEVL